MPSISHTMHLQLPEQMPAKERRAIAKREAQIENELRTMQESLQQKCTDHLEALRRRADAEEIPNAEEWIRGQMEEYERERQCEFQERVEQLNGELHDRLMHFLPDMDIDQATTPPAASSVSPEHAAHTPPDFLAGAEAITKRGSKRKLKDQRGLVIVQTHADVNALLEAEILSVGIARPEPTQPQLTRIVTLARAYAESKVQTWLPLDEEGRKAMWELVKTLLSEVFVRVPITSKSANGRFADKSPADLTAEELGAARTLIRGR